MPARVVCIGGFGLFVGGTLSKAETGTVPNLARTTAVGGMMWSGSSGWRLDIDLQWVDDRDMLNPRSTSVDVLVNGYFLANAKIGNPGN